jgi:hypothetical protein
MDGKGGGKAKGRALRPSVDSQAAKMGWEQMFALVRGQLRAAV